MQLLITLQKILNNCVIGKGVEIGKNCIIKNNVVIKNSIIKDNVVICDNTSIGTTGLVLTRTKEVHQTLTLKLVL